MDAHTVVHLVALLQTAQNGDGVHDRGLPHKHLLEAAFERGILFDVLAILIEGRRTDQAEFAAGEQWLNHVARVHCSFGRTSADDGVELVDEGDHVTLRVFDLFQHRLKALLKLTAVFSSGHHRGEVEGNNFAIPQRLGNVTLNNAQGQAFNNGRLTDAGFTDQHGVVLGAATQHLDDATNLFVTPDNGVQLAGPRQCSEVTAVFLEGLKGLFGVLRCDAS